MSELSGKKASVIIIDEFMRDHAPINQERINAHRAKEAKRRKKRNTKLALKKIRHKGKFKTVMIEVGE